ncbi:unnamed protein product [Cyprideis torosa]|uniref:Uncharacterized protein n=1 Tax=Cyprideis torosa TaxID=163714 RepID=A0A7R8WA29_9CRUS|nr:unnamed protein product [Cyprideis torosa]CAG0890505.1 unnamed protein product [Cyprideis torosa]
MTYDPCKTALGHAKCEGGHCKVADDDDFAVDDDDFAVGDDGTVVKKHCENPVPPLNYPADPPTQPKGPFAVNATVTFSCGDKKKPAGQTTGQTITSTCKKGKGSAPPFWDPPTSMGVCIKENASLPDEGCNDENCGPNSNCNGGQCKCSPGYAASKHTKICEPEDKCFIAHAPGNGKPTSSTVEMTTSVQLKCDPGYVVNDQGIYTDTVTAFCNPPTKDNPRPHLSYPVDVKKCEKVQHGGECGGDEKEDKCLAADHSMQCNRKTKKCECRKGATKITDPNKNTPPYCEFDGQCNADPDFDGNTVNLQRDPKDNKTVTFECKDQNQQIANQPGSTASAHCFDHKWILDGTRKGESVGTVHCVPVTHDSACEPNAKDDVCSKANLRCDPQTGRCGCRVGLYRDGDKCIDPGEAKEAKCGKLNLPDPPVVKDPPTLDLQSGQPVCH